VVHLNIAAVAGTALIKDIDLPNQRSCRRRRTVWPWTPLALPRSLGATWKCDLSSRAFLTGADVGHNDCPARCSSQVTRRHLRSESRDCAQRWERLFGARVDPHRSSRTNLAFEGATHPAPDRSFAAVWADKCSPKIERTTKYGLILLGRG
jgi:hypothetical protein